MTRFPALVLAACVCFVGVVDHPALAQAPPKSGVVSLGSVPTVTIAPGDSTAVVVPVVIADGFHVQANPASGEFLIPLKLVLRLAVPDSLVSIRPVYPAPALFRLEGTTEDLLTYHGAIGVEVVIRTSARAHAGERVLVGKLHYQACDNRRCLFPTFVPVALKVVISDAKNGK